MMINIAEPFPSLLSIQAKGIVRVWLNESNIGSGKIVLLCFLGQYKFVTKLSQETCFFSISAASNRHLSRKLNWGCCCRTRKKLDSNDFYQVGQNPLIETNRCYFYLPWLLAGRTRSFKRAVFPIWPLMRDEASLPSMVNVHVSTASKIIDFPYFLIWFRNKVHDTILHHECDSAEHV